MVAGMGFEPHDLRVMSPTSYQTALPRDIINFFKFDNYNTLYALSQQQTVKKFPTKVAGGFTTR